VNAYTTKYEHAVISCSIGTLRYMGGNQQVEISKLSKNEESKWVVLENKNGKN